MKKFKSRQKVSYPGHLEPFIDRWAIYGHQGSLVFGKSCFLCICICPSIRKFLNVKQKWKSGSISFPMETFLVFSYKHIDALMTQCLVRMTLSKSDSWLHKTSEHLLSLVSIYDQSNGIQIHNQFLACCFFFQKRYCCSRCIVAVPVQKFNVYYNFLSECIVFKFGSNNPLDKTFKEIGLN